MTPIIITGVICYIGGTIAGFGIAALMTAAGTESRREQEQITVPSETEVRRVARKIKRYCDSRNNNPETDCIECPIKDICDGDPYSWEV